LLPRLKSGGVDKGVRGWEKSSDHAPAWVELGDEAKAAKKAVKKAVKKRVA